MPGVSEAAFFTDAARKRVTEAVVDVESRTAAEVVVVVRRSSATWREVDLAAGAAVAFAVLLLLLFHPQPIAVVGDAHRRCRWPSSRGPCCRASIAPFKRALLPRKRVDRPGTRRGA